LKKAVTEPEPGGGKEGSKERAKTMIRPYDIDWPAFTEAQSVFTKLNTSSEWDIIDPESLRTRHILLNKLYLTSLGHI
jgi:hypothetical protein